VHKKICCSISPTIKTPNFKPKLWYFLANAVCCLPNLGAKKASHPVCEKMLEYVDEIDSGSPVTGVKLHFWKCQILKSPKHIHTLMASHLKVSFKIDSNDILG